MNTCARIESSGKAGHIQCSKETAELIEKGGKGGWLDKRADTVAVKGKQGRLQAYWVAVPRERTESVNSVASDDNLVASAVYGPKLPGLPEKAYRLIDWNVEMLLRIMKQMAALRAAKKNVSFASSATKATKMSLSSGKLLPSMFDLDLGKTPLEEVREIISLPEFDEKAARQQKDPDEVEIPQDVVEQLHLLVSKIACMYNNNPFHK